LKLSELSEPLAASVERILVEAKVPGAAVVVLHGGQRYIHTHGLRRINAPDAVDLTTAFDLGSCSKGFAATAVALLAAEGKLDLDEPVRRFLPELELDLPAATETVSARDLLANRLGFRRQVPLDAFANPELPPLDLVRRIAKLDRLHPFRGGYVYFNPGFVAVRLLVERVSGMGYGEFLEQRLFAPLGMRHSASGSPRVRRLSDRACGHVTWQGQVQEIHEDLFDNYQGAAGVHSCAEDATRWLRFQLEDRRDAILETHRPQTQIPRADCKLIHCPPEAERADYCLGWWTTTLHGRRLVQHAGEMFGWRAHIGLLPDEGTGVAVMLNCGVPRHAAIAYTVLEELLTGRSRDWCQTADRTAEQFNAATTQALETGFPAGSQQPLGLRPYVGRYRHPACGAVDIVEEAGGLQMHFADGRLWTQELRPLGGHVFETRPVHATVGDYFPVPLRLRFDVRDGAVLSITDSQARYEREQP
jgi:CubicO group peptidase (beta-lactamase class C family)